MTEWTFCKAEESDLPAVEAGYEAYLRWEMEQPQRWTVWKLGVYPNGETAAAAQAAGELYLLKAGEQLAASVILNSSQPEEYAAVSWQHPASAQEVLVIHTLCVSPGFAGRGVGSEVVRQAITLAGKLGCRVIRLDTGGQNLPALGLYTKLGFTRAGGGTILLGGAIPHTGHAFLEYLI